MVLGGNNPKNEGQQKRKADLGSLDNGLARVNPMEKDEVHKCTKKMRKKIRVEVFESMSSGVAEAGVQPHCSL